MLRIHVFLAALMMLTAAAGHAEEEAREVLLEAMGFVAGQEAKGCHLRLTDLLDAGGEPAETTIDMSLQLRGEADLRLTLDTGSMKAMVVANGDSRWYYSETDRTYMQAPAASTRAQLMYSLIAAGTKPAMAWVALFLHGKKDLLAVAKELSLEEPEDLSVDGTAIPCRRVRMVSESGVSEAWIGPPGRPLLYKMRMDLSDSLRELPDVPSNASRLVTVTFRGWDLTTTPDDTVFAFTPPANTSPPAPPGADALFRKTAPAIRLPLLDGGTMDIAEHRGKNVVVLEFWTTWCPGCQKGLPMAAAVAREFADKNVAFYAVNVGEPEDKVREYVEAKGIEAKVAMDPKNEAAKSYQVRSIPRTVVIDRNGVVTAGHVGVPADYKEQLRQDIRKALARPAE